MTTADDEDRAHDAALRLMGGSFAVLFRGYRYEFTNEMSGVRRDKAGAFPFTLRVFSDDRGFLGREGMSQAEIGASHILREAAALIMPLQPGFATTAYAQAMQVYRWASAGEPTVHGVPKVVACL